MDTSEQISGFPNPPSFAGMYVKGTAGGLDIFYKEATGTATAAATFNIATQVPSGAQIIGCQLRVDTALSANFDSAYNTGATAAISTNSAKEVNTKVNLMFDSNAATNIASAATDITITKNAGGNFTAGGVVRAIVYYLGFTTMASV